MRILVTNYDLWEYGGTQTWVMTMTDELMRRGHDVSAFTFKKGPFAEHLCCDVIEGMPDDEFDLLLINHVPCLEALKGHSGKKIFTAHGPSHQLEAMVDGADHYVAVSEEVDRKWWFFTPTVIRNPVDTQRFYPTPGENYVPKVLSLCKNVKGQDMVREACVRLGYTFGWAHRQSRPCYDVQVAINAADMVVSYGRGAYEALACNKPVLVFDARAGESRADGWLSKENVEELVQNNCSGRTNNLVWDVDDVERALTETQLTGWGPEWVRENHEVELIVDQYLSIGEK